MVDISKREIGFLAGGFFVGLILMGIMMWTMMPGMMLTVHKSKYDFETTVSMINQSSVEHGWVVPKIYNIQASLKEAGYEDATKIKIISLCQPDHAYKILKDDKNKKVTAIMPCRVGIYEDSKGDVYVSEMNIGLMSKMFGGTIEEVMGGVAKEEHEMFKDIFAD